MKDLNNLKPFDRFIYEDIYFKEVALTKEGSEIKSYQSHGFYTKKICEIIPKLKKLLGNFYNDMDIVNFLVDKNTLSIFSEFIKKLTENTKIEDYYTTDNVSMDSIIFGEEDIYIIEKANQISKEILKPDSNEELVDSFQKLNHYKVTNKNQLNYRIFIKLFDTKDIQVITPVKIILLDITDVISKFEVSPLKVKEKMIKKSAVSHVSPVFMSTDVCKDEKNVQENYGFTLRNYGFKQVGAVLRTDNIYSFKVNSEKEIRLLTEFKYDVDMNSDIELANLVGQTLAYLKNIEMSGHPIPELILCGDRNECILYTYESVRKYLNKENVNWGTSPSSFLSGNSDLFFEILNSEDKPFVYKIDDEFSFTTVVKKIKELGLNANARTKITVNNISTAFHYFYTNIIKQKDLSPNDAVNLFIQLLINPEDNYLHPRSQPKLVTKNFGDVLIDRRLYQSFILNYEGFNYNIKEREALIACSDMIIMEEDRRKQGEYYTPDILTVKADEYLSEYLGTNYKDEYYVWDCACGTGNLTRGFSYRHLFQSTLHQSDLQTMKQGGINPEARKFTFDFLNDSLDKIPSDLMNAINQNKKILFYINPPYATAVNWDETSKLSVSDTKTKLGMTNDGFGKSKENLYAQFFYRIWKIKRDYNLTNLFIGVFCPELFLSGGSYKEFRNKFLNEFNYLDGFLTPASMFADTSDAWGVLFSVWESGVNKNSDDFDVNVFGSKDNILKQLNSKKLYNLDNGIEASKWVREKIKNIKTSDAPQMSNAINVKSEGKTMRGNMIPGSFGYLFSGGNNVQSNTQNVALFTSAYTVGNGLSVTKDNFYECVTLFTARKLIQSNWVNQKNEYLAPNEEHPKWEQFKYDSIVYALFNTSSQQSSLRDVNYKDKEWNIKNEFFWVDEKKMLDAIKNSSNQAIYEDIKKFGGQRYVAELLYNDGIYNKLSDVSKFILNKATDAVIKSISIRDRINASRPELNLNAWDAGWYQIKALQSIVRSVDFGVNDVSEAYRELGDLLRPLVYELGFLK